jgi:rod shape-determining protein MreC
VGAPAVSGFSGFATSVKEFFLRLFGARDVDKEYEALKIRVQQLEVANDIMQDLQLENERLTKLLGFAEKFPNFEYIPARVIGRNPDSWFFYFDLNRSANDGVKKT